MKTPRFADGTPVPDDEVHYMPDVEAAYTEASRGRMAALHAKLQPVKEQAQAAAEIPVSTDQEIQCALRRFKPYPTYKDSGIEWLGEIPAHWEVKRIRDIADALQTGPFGSQLHADEYVFGGHPVINPANLRDGELVQDPGCTVDDSTAARLGHHRLRDGDIVFARRGELGRCGLVRRQEEGWALRYRLSSTPGPYR